MQEKEIARLHEIMQSQDWKIVNAAIDAYIAQLDSLADVDPNLSDADLALELKARRLAKGKLEAFLRDMRGYGLQEKATNPLTRSMR